MIKEAGVPGMHDDRWGQVPIAFVVANKTEMFDKEELRFFLKERLAGYKVPKQFYLVEALPRNASSKLLRKEILKLVPEGDGIFED
jgi:o-succinylbenzoate---CoA ligase